MGVTGVGVCDRDVQGRMVIFVDVTMCEVVAK